MTYIDLIFIFTKFRTRNAQCLYILDVFSSMELITNKMTNQEIQNWLMDSYFSTNVIVLRKILLDFET